MRHNYLSGYNFIMRPLPELKFLVQRLLYSDFLCTYLNLFLTVCFIKKIGIANILFVMEIWDRVSFMRHLHIKHSKPFLVINLVTKITG